MSSLIAAFLAALALMMTPEEHPPRVLSEPPEPIVEEPAPPPEQVPLLLSVDFPSDALWSAAEEFFPHQTEKAVRVVHCESRGQAGINTGNGYYGAWQFDLVTWRGVGGNGLPSEASIHEQTMRARILYDMRGWQPWPVCGLR